MESEARPGYTGQEKPPWGTGAYQDPQVWEASWKEGEAFSVLAAFLFYLFTGAGGDPKWKKISLKRPHRYK